MRFSATVDFDFCAGHRLRDHPGKCSGLHGHNWTVSVTLSSDRLDHCGRVADFSDVRRIIKAWVDDELDHGFMLEESDTEAIDAVASVPGSKLFVLRWPPSAERIAELIFVRASEMMITHIPTVRVVSVRIGENGRSTAECTA